MKTLIIGYGSIGKRHSEILSSIDLVSIIHIVSSQDGLPYKTYQDISDIPDLEFYDYFVISSPTANHFEQLSYINSRVVNKKILVEKPLFSKKCSIHVQNQIYVAYNLRFHPVMDKLHHLLQNKTIISVNVNTGQYLPEWRPGRDYRESYSASAESGGGVLLDLSHEIDYLLYLFGNIRILGAIKSKISDLEINSDDFVSVIGTFDNGAVLNLSMNYISKIPMRRIIIDSHNETIIADFVAHSLTIKERGSEEPRIETFENNRNTSYLAMHKALLENHFGKICDYNEGLKTMEVIHSINLRNLYEK